MDLTKLLLTKQDMLVVVDRCRFSNLEGRILFHGGEMVTFPSTNYFIYAINLYLDENNGPQQTRDFRSFKKKIDSEKMIEGVPIVGNEFKDGKGSFLIKVQYRHNSTLQGTIKWLEEDKVVNFRSALEMLKLIDSAIIPEEETPVGWDTVSKEEVL